MYESMIFYRSFYDAIQGLDAELQAEIYNAVFKYGLYGELDELSPIANTVFTLIKPQIDANNKRKENGKKGAEYGKLGGRPKKDNPEETPKEPQENPAQPPNVNENANVNDNDNIYIVGKPRQDTPKTQKDDQTEKDIQTIVDYLNAKTQSKYSAKTNETRKSITARLKDGYTIDDFKAVIDSKVKEWFNDAEMRKYLRPSTLFRPSNFESYLNEANRPAVKSKNQFNNFEQNQYDYDELERRLTANVKSG